MILAGQRTGSTWLRDVLNGHPEVAAYDELFLEDRGGFPQQEFGPTDVERFESWLGHRASPRNPLARAWWAWEYLNGLYDRSVEKRALGFKLMYSQVRRNPAAAAYLARHRVMVIHLTRQNLLDIVLSQATADARNQPHAWEGEEVKQVRVSLEPDETVARFKRIERQRLAARQFLRVFRLPALELKYEDLVEDSSGFAAAFRFLGVDDSWSPTSTMQRINRSPKGQLIENWDELRRALADTRFSRFLAE